MEFTAYDLRHLRYRMNWTQAEMARTLGCEIECVAARERGVPTAELTPRERGHIVSLQAQADANSGHVQRRAMADGLMSTRGLSQILDGDVIDCLVDGELANQFFR